MKLEQLYESLLEESMSDVVYHATDFMSAINILQSDSLRSKTGAISTTRSMTGKYHLDNRMISAIFELDGRMLNQKYRGQPVGTEDLEDDGDYMFSVVMRGKQNGQLEDRLLTGEIKNFVSYIKAIHTHVPDYIIDSLRTAGGRKYFEDALEIPYFKSLEHLQLLLKTIKRKLPKTLLYIHTGKTPNKYSGLQINSGMLLDRVDGLLASKGKEFVRSM